LINAGRKTYLAGINNTLECQDYLRKISYFCQSFCLIPQKLQKSLRLKIAETKNIGGIRKLKICILNGSNPEGECWN
jgi:hypothetical protein